METIHILTGRSGKTLGFWKSGLQMYASKDMQFSSNRKLLQFHLFSEDCKKNTNLLTGLTPLSVEGVIGGKGSVL